MECGKCRGRGVIERFGHISGGMCYQCHGRGVIADRSMSEYSVRKKAPVEGVQYKWYAIQLVPINGKKVNTYYTVGVDDTHVYIYKSNCQHYKVPKHEKALMRTYFKIIQ
jgi:hypothetical protein